MARLGSNARARLVCPWLDPVDRVSGHDCLPDPLAGDAAGRSNLTPAHLTSSRGGRTKLFAMATTDQDKLFALLDDFQIETPSWGYADTGTRFGKFLQPAAASSIDEKLADAGT